MIQKDDATWLKWTSQSIRPQERFEAWQSMLNSSHLSWNLDSGRTRQFFADLDMGKIAGIQVVQTACAPCSGERTSLEIDRDNVDYYGLLLITKGIEEVECRGRRSLLEPGWLLIWDSTEPISFKLHSPVQKVTLFLKQDRLRRTLPQTPGLVGKAIDWQRGFGAVAATHLSALASQLAYMDPQKAQPMAENTIELIATCLDNGSGLTGGAAQADLIARIKNHIENHLDDPDIGPPQLADHFGISVRYLHLLFKEESLSVSRWIMERRLERCRRELVRSGARKNVTEVAFRWGFNDSAHFSRAFKKRYGRSPKDYRDQGSA